MDWLQSAQIRCNPSLPHAFAPQPGQVYLTRVPDFFGLDTLSRIAASAQDKANPDCKSLAVALSNAPPGLVSTCAGGFSGSGPASMARGFPVLLGMKVTSLLSCVCILELFVCGYRDAVFSLVLVLFVSEFLGLIFVERVFD